MSNPFLTVPVTAVLAVGTTFGVMKTTQIYQGTRIDDIADDIEDATSTFEKAQKTVNTAIAELQTNAALSQQGIASIDKQLGQLTLQGVELNRNMYNLVNILAEQRADIRLNAQGILVNTKNIERNTNDIKELTNLINDPLRRGPPE